MDHKEIDPDKYYSARQVSLMGVLPWSSAWTFTRVLRDEKWAAIFKPVVEQKAKGVRFYVKGENVLAFIKAADAGELNKL